MGTREFKHDTSMQIWTVHLIPSRIFEGNYTNLMPMGVKCWERWLLCRSENWPHSKGVEVCKNDFPVQIYTFHAVPSKIIFGHFRFMPPHWLGFEAWPLCKFQHFMQFLLVIYPHSNPTSIRVKVWTNDFSAVLKLHLIPNQKW